MFERFLSFIETYSSEIIGISTILIVFLKTRSVNKTMEVFSRMVENKTQMTVKNAVGQDFENGRFQPVYRFNKASGELELTDEVIDIDELINSAKDSCLESVLARFSELQAVPKSDSVAYQAELQDDLDGLAQIMTVVNDYKDKYNLDPNLSANEVFDFVNKESQRVKLICDKAKEVKENEKTQNIQESK